MLLTKYDLLGFGFFSGCVFVFVLIWDMVSLCSSDYSGTHNVDQAGFELMEICVALSTKCCSLLRSFFLFHCLVLL